MADVVARATQPALGAIKLAWWRERLRELDEGKVPAEPRLQAAAEELLPRGIKGADLSEIEDGWLTLLEEVPDPERIAARGNLLFALAARLLGVDDARVVQSGGLFAVADVLRRSLRPELPSPEIPKGSMPRRARPVTALAALAARDVGGPPFELEATPGRAWALIRHRFTGRL